VLDVCTSLRDKRFATVAVVDTGQGIDPQQLPKLFNSFFTTKHDGMGLGLSVARTIVEAHGGMIWAENNTARGAAFHFTVPLNAA
jgi:signal transduction histidine kinase